MEVINLKKYLFQINNLNSFYSYCKTIFTKEEIRNEIKEQELKNMLNLIKSYPNIIIDKQYNESILKNTIELSIDENINQDIYTLRQQILVSAFSILEIFLGNIVRIYINNFPAMLKESNNKIKAREILKPKNINSIPQYITEQEIIYFERLSLKEKKGYLYKNLIVAEHNNLGKLDNKEFWNDLWKLDGKELWQEINDKRNVIVHSEKIIELSDKQIQSYLYYFNRIIFGMLLYTRKLTGLDYFSLS
jgi:hypothetical protein